MRSMPPLWHRSFSAVSSRSIQIGTPWPVSSSRGRSLAPTSQVLVPGPVKGDGLWPSPVATRSEWRVKSGSFIPIMESVTIRPGCFSIARSPNRSANCIANRRANAREKVPQSALFGAFSVNYCDLSMITVEDQAQSLQREEFVNFLDSFGLGCDEARHPAGRDDMQVVAAFLADARHQPIDQRGIAEDQS